MSFASHNKCFSLNNFTQKSALFLTKPNLQQSSVNENTNMNTIPYKYKYKYKYTNISTKLLKTDYCPAFPGNLTPKECQIWTTN